MKPAVLLLLVLAAGCTGQTSIKYQGIDGKQKQIDIGNKTYQQICVETLGTWMDAADGMREIRNGKETGEACDGCMTDGGSMYCRQKDYIDAIRIN